MANGAARPQFHKILSNSIRKGYSVNEKSSALKRFSPTFYQTAEVGEIPSNSAETDRSTGTIMKQKTSYLIRLLLTTAAALPAFAQAVQQPAAPQKHTPEKTVQERLGYPASARLLVIHADDLGMNHSANRAIFEALEKGWVTSASILVPCPWFPEVVKWSKEHPTADLGIHQALNSEWTTLRWGPVGSKDKVPSLLDPDGYLPLETPAVSKNAQLSEAELELHAQIDRAQSAGLHLTHLDSHMEALFGTPDLYNLYQQMGHKYGLPILQARAGSHSPEAVAPPVEEVLVEKVIEIAPGIAPQDWTAWYREQLKSLGPGVYQVIVHLAYDDDEMRAATYDHPDWGAAWRQHDFDMVKSPEFRQFLKEQGFVLVGWKELSKALPANYAH
jgi:chitin disaccharide deacetylase